MKELQIVSICVLIAALLIMGAHLFLVPLSAWIVRIDGAIMLIGIFAAVFSSVKRQKEK